MFSGIISECGLVKKIIFHETGITVFIELSSKLIQQVNIGDSVSVNGVCSTVVSCSNSCIEVDYLPETLSKTNFSNLYNHQFVNIELSLRLNDFVSGHLVSGHVDGTGQILSYDKDNQWHVLHVDFDQKFSPLIVEKGWIVVNGIALTVVDILKHSFTCHIIPHTHAVTFLSKCKVGDKVNLEFDMIAKYVQRFISNMGRDFS